MVSRRISPLRRLTLTLTVTLTLTLFLCALAAGCESGYPRGASPGCYVYNTLDDAWKSNCERRSRLTQFDVRRIPRDARALIIEGNLVPVLKQETFYNVELPAVLNLTLRNNSIQVIERYTFVNFSVLEMLDLSHNNLYLLSSKMLAGPRDLRSLCLSNNKITFLRPTVFDSFPYLRHVDLSGNRIVHLPEDLFTGLSPIVTLLLRDNMIDDIPDKLLMGTRNMRLLDLTGNRLRRNINDGLELCTSLRSLLIANTGVKTLPVLPGLTTLDMSNTSIRDVPVRQLQQMPLLSRVNMSGMSIRCDCDLLAWLAAAQRELTLTMDGVVCLPERGVENASLAQRLRMNCPPDVTPATTKTTGTTTWEAATDNEVAGSVPTGDGLDEGKTGGSLKGEETAAIEQEPAVHCIGYVLGMCITGERLTYILTGAGCIVALLFLAVIATARRYGRRRDSIEPPLPPGTPRDDDVSVTTYPGDVSLGMKKYARHFSWLPSSHGNRLNASLHTLSDVVDAESQYDASTPRPTYKRRGSDSWRTLGRRENDDDDESRPGPSQADMRRATSMASVSTAGPMKSALNKDASEIIESNQTLGSTWNQSDAHILI